MTDADNRAPGRSMSLAEDRALLDAWCRGDKAAGEQLIRYCFDSVSGSVHRWLRGDDAATMDVVQASFEVALEKRAAIQGAFGPYVRGIARLKVLEHLRRKDAVAHELVSSIGERVDGAEAVLVGEQQERLAIAALRRLSPEQQDVMYLRYVQGMKLRTIAELAGMTTSKLAGILRRAEQQLAREVEQLAESPRLGQSTLIGVRTWLRRREGDDEPEAREP